MTGSEALRDARPLLAEAMSADSARTKARQEARDQEQRFTIVELLSAIPTQFHWDCRQYARTIAAELPALPDGYAT